MMVDRERAANDRPVRRLVYGCFGCLIEHVLGSSKPLIANGQPAARPWLMGILCGWLALSAIDARGQLPASPPPGSAPGQPTESVPHPQWIGTATLREGRKPVVLRTVVDLPAGIRQGSLEAIADFADVQVLINGQRAGRLEPYQSVAQWDVTPWLEAGDNELAFAAIGTGGPAAMAVRLTWTDNDDRSGTRVTDAAWHSEGESIESYGKVEPVLWSGNRGPVALSPLEDYTQWKRALDPGQATAPSTFIAPPGFEVELLHTAATDEGSWVAMAFDPQGDLTVALEERGLIKLSFVPSRQQIRSVQPIDDSLEECRGLVYHEGALYANANNSKALFRLTDTSGDGRFDRREMLYAAKGGGGHGRNALAIGPDNQLYAIHGDSVALPRDFADRTSPVREHRRGEATSEGHLLQIRRDARPGEILAAGLRNPFGLAFNHHGEAFTYDADAEYDMGAPWYRATRVKHLITGADFGWRGVTGTWPPYYPDHCDNAPHILEVGRGSPTAVRFATGSAFPAPYSDALFILDWSYGRVMAVQMEPRGSSYACLGETFLQGRPLNVTGLEFGPDGAMYLITGGRKTQSALYRVRYVGAPSEPSETTAQQQARRQHAEDARERRQRLQQLLGEQSDPALQAAWPILADADPWIRYVARTVLEHQPPQRWAERAFQEQRFPIAAAALLALARCDAASYGPQVAQRLVSLSLESLAPREQMMVLYTAWLCLEAHPEDVSIRTALLTLLAEHYPSQAVAADQRQQWNLWASRILVRIAPEIAVPRTMELLLHSSENQRQQLHYLFVLRSASQGWTEAARRLYFRRLDDASYFEGGAGMPQFLDRIREEALATLDDDERLVLVDVLQGEDRDLQPTGPPRRLVQRWTVDELETLLADHQQAKSKLTNPQLTQDQFAAQRKRGQRLFAEAQCASCHRFAGQGRPFGPDLTHVARRFSPRDLLHSIVNPSDVIADEYRSMQIMTDDGQVHIGRVLAAGDFRESTLQLVTDLAHPERVTLIDKQSILEYRPSSRSPMPDGLLDVLTAEEILALLDYLDSGESSAE